MARQADIKNRSVRIRNLPTDTQEGLLQQALEKVVPITRVEVFSERNEAVAELATIAVSMFYFTSVACYK